MCFDYIIIIFCFVFEKKKAGPQKQHNTSPQVYLFAFFLHFISYQNLGRRNYAFAQEHVYVFVFKILNR